MIKFPGDDQRKDASRQSYGAFVDTGGAERYGSVDGNSISVTNLSANNITSGSIDASEISVTNLNADEISSGTLSADRIGANSISASKIEGNTITASEIASSTITATELNVSTLSAITADLGTVNAGTINGNTINVGTGYGGGISVYDQDTLEFYNSSNAKTGYIGGASNYLEYGSNLVGHRFYGLVRLNDDDLQVDFGDVVVYEGEVWVSGCAEIRADNKLKMNNNIDMNEYTIDACDTIWANSFNNRCEIAEGIDPFEVMASFEPEEGEKNKKKEWRKVDHKKLHSSVYQKTTRKVNDRKPTKNKKNRNNKLKKQKIEKEEEVEGYSLTRLVELQRQAILQLNKELKEIKNA